jgi:hypothetical protein
MPTSSFEKSVVITEESVESLIEILNSENTIKVDLSTDEKVEKLNASDVEEILKKKTHHEIRVN